MRYDYRAYEYEKAKDDAMRRSIAVASVVSVISADLLKGTVDVQPLCKTMIDGKYESQPPLLNVPVLKHRDSDGNLVSPSYQAGDIGLVVFCDSDIDNIIISRAESEPSSERVHAVDDGIFVGVI